MTIKRVIAQEGSIVWFLFRLRVGFFFGSDFFLEWFCMYFDRWSGRSLQKVNITVVVVQREDIDHYAFGKFL